MFNHTEIHEILYAEVFDATNVFEKSKGTLAYEPARVLLNRAVQRYTDFSLDGKIPDDLLRLVTNSDERDQTSK